MKNLALALVLLISAASCSGRNLHKDLTADTNVLIRKWTLATHGPYLAGDRGFEYSNPVLIENTLVFGNQSVGLVALYPTLNSQRWVLPIPGGVVSELAVSGGNIYFGGGDGFIYCVSLENGRVQWRYEVRNPVVSRPTVSGGRAFVTTSDDTLYALDAGTGKWLWHYKRRTAPNATIHGASSPLVDQGEVLAGMSDGFLVALNQQDGQLRWERKLHQGSKFTDVDAKPILDGGVLYVPSYDGALYALKRQGGEVLWRFDAGGSRSVTIEGSVLYLPSSDGYVYALARESGKMLWKFELDGGAPTHIVVADDKLIFGSTYQYLYVLDRATGKGMYRYNVGYDSGFAGSPAFDRAAQRVYFLSGAGNLFAFEVRRPRKVMSRAPGDGYQFN